MRLRCLEPGHDEQVSVFCSLGVKDANRFNKADLNGPETRPTCKCLKEKEVLGDITWNFASKFVVDDRNAIEILSVNRLHDVLDSNLTDGIECICLVTLEGSLLCSATRSSIASSIRVPPVTDDNCAPPSTPLADSAIVMKDNLLTALYSCVFNTSLQGCDEVSCQIVSLQQGAVVIVGGSGSHNSQNNNHESGSTSFRHLLCTYGRTAPLGLRARMLSLSLCFTKIFEQT